jgi:hypothetical protein
MLLTNFLLQLWQSRVLLLVVVVVRRLLLLLPLPILICCACFSELFNDRIDRAHWSYMSAICGAELSTVRA